MIRALTQVHQLANGLSSHSQLATPFAAPITVTGQPVYLILPTEPVPLPAVPVIPSYQTSKPAWTNRD